MEGDGNAVRAGEPGGVVPGECLGTPREECPVREILDRIGDKWSVLVVFHLSQGTLRFSQLRRRIDHISHRMLTATLRGLERDGLVNRTPYATIPPRVEYALTDLGQTLLDPIQALERWARENRLEVSAARAAYDEKRPARRPPARRHAPAL